MSETSIVGGLWHHLRPPPRSTLSEWSEAHYYLSAESSAESGRWRCYPYQRGIMDAITDPQTEWISLMKSARVGATKIMNATVGYYMHQDPCPIMVVQPTVDDAKGYSKEEIAPMLRDCETLLSLVGDSKSKTSEATILHKKFPGGVLAMVGANSGTGFRRVSRRVVIFDEVDGYPPSAGNEGDQIKLGIKRTDHYWNRKIIAASTPLTAGASRIETMFDEGDQRRYHVPCPQCGHEDIFVFRKRDDERGHVMTWPDDQPEAAYFVCSKNGCIIEHVDKRSMLEGGKWIADAKFKGHASFHIWAAYSLAFNTTWGQIAEEFITAKRAGVEALKTFVNTVLGETWQERGEAPSWERVYNRREPYPIGSVPGPVKFLTTGVDVQKDRFIFEVVGWALTKESYSIDAGVLFGDTSDETTWRMLDELVGRTFPGADGAEWPIAMLAIDSGYNTQQVYSWARRYPMSRVIAVKGVATARTLIGMPSPVDVTARGKRHSRGYKVWPVGGGIAKSELYGWLRLPLPVDGEEPPPGYCHFPEYDSEFFKQLTAEQMVTVKKRNGFVALEWQLLPGRENHYLDCRVYARAAASVQGLDRIVVQSGNAPPTPKARTQKAKSKRESSWLHGGKKEGWLGRR